MQIFYIFFGDSKEILFPFRLNLCFSLEIFGLKYSFRDFMATKA